MAGDFACGQSPLLRPPTWSGGQTRRAGAASLTSVWVRVFRGATGAPSWHQALSRAISVKPRSIWRLAGSSPLMTARSSLAAS